MERQEIVSGLKNAVERGYSIELAVQSFVNAGYSRQDVFDSAKLLGYNSGIISNLPQPQQETSQPQQIDQSSQNQQAMQYPPLPSPQIQEKKRSWLAENWIILLLILLLLILVSGFLASIFAKDSVLRILSSIGINLG